jgi:hypothetical protein
MPWFKVYSTDWFAPLTSVGAAGPVLSSGGLTPVIKHACSNDICMDI